MNQLVQAAIDAANTGNKPLALENIKKALTANSNDVDGWLVLAALVESDDRKRQCLQRALAIDPSNQIAREELLQMDRVAMGGASTPAPVPTLQPARPQPARSAPVQTNIPPRTANPAPAAKAPVPTGSGAPVLRSLNFSYPLWMRIILYGMAVMALPLVILSIFNPALLVFNLASLLFLIGAWMVSVRIEISGQGIRKAQMLRNGQITWQEIASLKSNPMQRNLELRSKGGRVLKITTQVSGYPKIIEILRQKRPDLFGLASPRAQTHTGTSSAQTSYGYGGDVGSTPVTSAFSGSRVFKTSFIKRYGSIILGVIILPIGLPGFWSGSTENIIGAALFVLVSLYLIAAPFFAIHEIKLEPGKLTLGGMFNEDEFRPNQIASINLQAERGRRGTATNYVVVKPVDGKAVSLIGFEKGDEVLYGTLVNWWNNGRG